MSQPPSDFNQRLHHGYRWQQHVAAAFEANGLRVDVPALRVAPTLASRRAYFDSGDLFVHANRAHRIEVKSRRFAFTNEPTSYPYPDCLLDTESVTTQKLQAGSITAYVIVSQATGAMLVVPMSQRERFILVHSTDRRRLDVGIVYKKWSAPVAVIRRFDELITWLHARKRRETHHDHTARSQSPW